MNITIQQKTLYVTFILCNLNKNSSPRKNVPHLMQDSSIRLESLRFWGFGVHRLKKLTYHHPLEIPRAQRGKKQFYDPFDHQNIDCLPPCFPTAPPFRRYLKKTDNGLISHHVWSRKEKNFFSETFYSVPEFFICFIFSPLQRFFCVDKAV